MNFRKLLKWIPTLAIMILLFALSAQSYEEQNLQPEIERKVTHTSASEWLDGISFTYAGREISAESLGTAGFIEFFIRKGAHFSVYGLLGLFVAFALNSGRRGRDFGWTVVISFLYACSDELHQTFMPDRTGLVEDVMLDTTGAAFGALVMLLIWRIVERRKAKARCD
ncbi:VanZ family protein [Paenibacillus vini]|uniref:VanZ family protein n=1 Tax=Paenibacillus vini TaxID=1476024 RepID=A0ABQ4M6K4_9BACL|nr:VanZ family protein [Paenibacillus vini]GIP51630.1 VanZ family protein [Paenibacillus vini]